MTHETPETLLAKTQINSPPMEGRERRTPKDATSSIRTTDTMHLEKRNQKEKPYNGKITWPLREKTME